MKAMLLGPIQQENLALGYLASAARKQGHDVKIAAYAYRADLDTAVAAIEAYNPDLVGLGIAFQNNVDDYVLLIASLRKRGFRGHITCGGHVATFCYEELLGELPELDTAVRHDGEQTLCEMLAMLSHGESPRDIAGLVWREGDGIKLGPTRTAALDLDALPWPARGNEAYLVGGIVVDFLITARGCIGECNYCSIAAYTSEQKKRYRLRAPQAVAEEIAFAYHERGARVFFMQDDLFVLPSETKAVDRMRAIGSETRARGVRDVVYWIKGRPEHVTPAVCKAAREMGAIHMFLGVENASASRLEYLGRTHLPMHNNSAIANCRAERIVPSFNFMLFDPDCSLDDVEITLDMAEKNLDLPWNVCRTEVYSGTSLLTRLRSEGRLEGDWRSFGYRMTDLRAELMFRILRVAFHERALAIESLLNRLISLSFSRQLHESFFPGARTDALSREAIELGIEVRRDTIMRLREVLAWVNGGPRTAVDARRYAIDLGLAIGEWDASRRARAHSLWEYYNGRGMLLMARRGQVPGHARVGIGVAAGS